MRGRETGLATRIEREVAALALAARDPRTPLPAKLAILCVVGYALSPIDLIPDPIPVLGLLDDAILLPIGVALTIRLIPPAVMAESRSRAAGPDRRYGRWAAAAIIALWLAALLVAVQVARAFLA